MVRISTVIIERYSGSAALMSCPISIRATLQVLNRHTPNGGVTMPMARFRTNTTAKWIGWITDCSGNGEEDRCHDDDRYSCIEEHSHEKKEEVDDEEDRHLIRREPEKEISNDLR